MAKHTRGFVFLTVLLCLVLLAVSPAAHASGSVSEEPACPAVASAVLGARQVRVAQRYVAGKNADAVAYPWQGDAIPLYRDDPQGCIAAALMLEGSVAISELGLADLNGDGVPELLLPAMTHWKLASFAIHDISGGRVVTLNGLFEGLIWELGKIYDAEGRPGICVCSVGAGSGFTTDGVQFLFYDPAKGWHVRSASYYTTEFGAFADLTAHRPPRETSVWENRTLLLDPGDLLYKQMLQQPVEWYTIPDADKDEFYPFRNTGFIAWVENERDPIDWMTFCIDLSEPEVAWEMAGKLLDAWQNFEPVEPVAGYTVYDILTMDHDM